MYSHLVLCLLRCALSSEIDMGSMHSTRMRDSPSYLREHSEAASKMGAVTFVILARLASVIAVAPVTARHHDPEQICSGSRSSSYAHIPSKSILIGGLSSSPRLLMTCAQRLLTRSQCRGWQQPPLVVVSE